MKHTLYLQDWLKKAKEVNQTQKDKDQADSELTAENKKRKREEDKQEVSAKKQKDADLDVKKTPLSQSTNSKLANFAFSKSDN